MHKKCHKIRNGEELVLYNTKGVLRKVLRKLKVIKEIVVKEILI